MKRMVLGYLIFSLISLISFSPVFAKGVVTPDESTEGDSPTAGQINTNDKLNVKASNALEKDIDTNVDKTETFGDATETNTEK